jgi:hypothetical protein
LVRGRLAGHFTEGKRISANLPAFLFYKPAPPVIRAAALVRDREDTDFIRGKAVVNRVGRTVHDQASDLILNHTKPLRQSLNPGYRFISHIQKLTIQRKNTIFIKPSGFDKLQFIPGMVNQAHPMAFRAACMTSPWVRPVTAPDSNSPSVRIASRKASFSLTST